MSVSTDNKNRIDCFRCRHFAVTWEPGSPRGCSFHGFKTALIPSAVVYRSSGKPCMGFEEKTPGKT